MDVIRVALGVIRNRAGQCLISYRNARQDASLQWGFPGGKLEPGESYKTALRRELWEETGLRVKSAKSFIRFSYAYPHRVIDFHVFLVETYGGMLDRHKCPDCKWSDVGALEMHTMPAANQTIVNALRLPAEYMITADSANPDFIYENVSSNLDTGVSLLQLRAHSLSMRAYQALAERCYRLCENYSARLIVNCSMDWLPGISAHGFHLSSERMRAVSQEYCHAISFPLFSVSCHNLEELNVANGLTPECVVIAPVLPTPSHPGVNILDWSGFQALALQANVAAYALGGLQWDHINLVKAHGGQGVAGISLFQ